MDFRVEDITQDEIDRRLAVVEPLTDAVRDLVDAVIRSTVDDAELIAARGRIEEITAALRTRQLDGPYGTAFTKEFIGMPWGNAVVGARNALAPPLRIEQEQGGIAHCRMTLGAAYEGPGGCVHGGVSAMLLDELCGEAAAVEGRPSFTGTLTVKYLQPLPLNVPLRGRADVIRRDGRKTFVRGTLAAAAGVAVEAEAIMIAPKGFELPTE